MEVDHTKWRVDQFADMFQIEFGHHSAGIRVVLKHFAMLQNCSNETITYMWHILFCVVLLNRLQVLKG